MGDISRREEKRGGISAAVSYQEKAFGTISNMKVSVYTSLFSDCLLCFKLIFFLFFFFLSTQRVSLLLVICIFFKLAKIGMTISNGSALYGMAFIRMLMLN